MVETLALRIATALKKAEPERTASVDVMKFALEGLLNTLITLCLIGMVGLATSSFSATMTGYAAFAVLRFFAGGLHLKSAASCSLVSTALISIAPHIPLTDNEIVVIGLASLVLVLILAPANMEGHARIPSKYFILLKFIAVLIVASNFIWLNSTICMVYAIQALTMIPYRKRR